MYLLKVHIINKVYFQLSQMFIKLDKVRAALPLSVRIVGLETITLQVGKQHYSLQYAVLCVPVLYLAKGQGNVSDHQLLHL